jgi:DNA-directed RNA polymerase specialized sigma subunit
MPETTDPYRETITQLAAITDPAERARTISAALDAVPALQAELRSVRQAAVLAMRETMTGAQVAEALGISVPRVSQITKGISRTAKH